MDFTGTLQGDSDLEKKEWMEDCDFHLVTSLDECRKVVDRAIQHSHCALDLETSGLDKRRTSSGETFDKIAGYCLSFDTHEGYYIPVRHKRKSDDKLYEENVSPSRTAKEMNRLINNTTPIFHNASFDQEFLDAECDDVDFTTPDSFEDTLILDYLRNSSANFHGLKALAKTELDPPVEMFSLSEVMGENAEKNFSTLDPSDEATHLYAISDAICTLRLYRQLKKYGEEQESIYWLEKKLVPVLRWMFRHPVKIDRRFLDNISRGHPLNWNQPETPCGELNYVYGQTLDHIVEGFEQYTDYITKHHGDPSRPEKWSYIQSGQKLGNLLKALQESDTAPFNITLHETPDGQIKTDEDEIDRMVEKCGDDLPFLKKIEHFRSLEKAQGFAEPFLRSLEENKREENELRFNFRPYRVETGRFSSTGGDPSLGVADLNVQQLPGCYNAAKFPVKKIHDRPSGVGDEDAEYVEELETAVEEQDFLRKIYDGHFIMDNSTEEEFCVRSSCEGCPFLENCDHDEPKDHRFLSVDASIRRAVKARDDHVIAAIDYSGLELRTAANLSGEEKWIEEFYRCGNCGEEFDEKRENGETPPRFCPECGEDDIGDLHTLTAKLIWGEDVVNRPDFKMYRQKGKCVTGDTLVQTDRGMVPIKDLDPGSDADEFVEFENPVEVWTDGGIQKATHFYNGGVQDTIQITTDGRFTLEGTDTHRIRVFDREEGYSWKALSDITVGDKVVIDRGGDVFPEEPHEAPLDPFYSDRKASEDNRARIPLTPDWCYFLGVITGDGCVQETTGVTITYDTRDEEWESRFESLLDRLGLKFNRRDETNKNHTGAFTISSRRLSRALHKWGMKELSTTARIPRGVLRTTPKGQKAFLRGLFDADGSINQNGYVRLHSSSTELLKEVQTMLASFGVFGRIRLRHTDHPLTGKDYYDLCIGGIEAARFGDIVGFSLPRKSERLQSEGETRDKIPFPEQHVSADAPHDLLRTRQRDGLTYRMIDRHRDEYDFPDEVEWLRDRRVRIAEVTSVEEHREQVYDLTVPETQSFWANGFINHNSTNFAILYGGGAKTVGEIMGAGRQKGKKIKKKVLGGLSTLQEWMDEKVNEAYQNDEVSTHMGRKIRFHGQGQYRAVNCVVQGTATGDLTRLAMVLVWGALRKTADLENCRMFASMHDEIVFEIKKDSLDEVIPLVRERMTAPGDLWDFEIPLQVDVEIGERWDTFCDWDKIHYVDPETGKAKAPTPEFLRGHIEMKPGMYFEGEEPGEAIDVPSGSGFEEEKEEVEKKEAEPDTPDIEEDDTTVEDDSEDLDVDEEPDSQDPEVESSGPKEITVDESIDSSPEETEIDEEDYDLPVYTYQTDRVLSEGDTQQFMMQLMRVTDFFKNVYTGGDHLLVVEDHMGRTILKPSGRKVVVDPSLFAIIARYEGI